MTPKTPSAKLVKFVTKDFTVLGAQALTATAEDLVCHALPTRTNLELESGVTSVNNVPLVKLASSVVVVPAQVLESVNLAPLVRSN